MTATGTLDAPTAAQNALAGVARACAALEVLADLDPHDLPEDTLLRLLDGLEGLRRRTEALTTRTLAVVETDGRWAVEGARSFASWWRYRSGRHASTASREVRRARALRDHLPATAAALMAGRITADHASTLAHHTTDSDARRAKLADPDVGEDFLVGYATKMDASRFARVVRTWSHRVDPQAADRTYVEDSDREEFFLAETTDGYVPGGWLSPSTGRTLMTALKARIGTPAADDRRSPAQRRAAALGDLARLALDSGTLRPGARIRPHLAVTVPLETLETLAGASTPAHRAGCPAGTHPAGTDPAGTDPAGTRPSSADCVCAAFRPDRTITADLDAAALADAEPATFDDGNPVAPTLLARLTCSSHLHRVIFGPDSEVLDVGREERLFTAAQTRAIIARDGHCRFPGCDGPPGEGEIHHSIWWWSQQGETRTALGILLCWHHHDWVHKRRVTIERDDGRWRFYRRDGTEIHDPVRRT
ncbi:HNH endonuclease signature motif containing protein [Georgenia alba]|uniref:DUF222 domain-containing protein n=1 Tax=Georgenia alba TaxID=2233858 RepID=A0ABW2Q7Z5_9MICO